MHTLIVEHSSSFSSQGKNRRKKGKDKAKKKKKKERDRPYLRRTSSPALQAQTTQPHTKAPLVSRIKSPISDK